MLLPSRWAVVYSTTRKTYEVALMPPGVDFHAPPGCLAVQVDIELDHARAAADLMNDDLMGIPPKDLEDARDALNRKPT